MKSQFLTLNTKPSHSETRSLPLLFLFLNFFLDGSNHIVHFSLKLTILLPHPPHTHTHKRYSDRNSPLHLRKLFHKVIFSPRGWLFDEDAVTSTLAFPGGRSRVRGDWLVFQSLFPCLGESHGLYFSVQCVQGSKNCPAYRLEEQDGVG